MNLTPSEAKRLGIDAGPKDATHGAKVKADMSFGKQRCRELIEAVYAITGERGVIEHVFHDVRKWPLDAAWPQFKIAVELNGWTSHHRKGRIREDNVKRSAAVRMGWKVLYADVDQIKRNAALWVAELIEQEKAHP